VDESPRRRVSQGEALESRHTVLCAASEFCSAAFVFGDVTSVAASGGFTSVDLFAGARFSLLLAR
jgi:hypothetical protein